MHAQIPSVGSFAAHGYQQPAAPRQFLLQLVAEFEGAGVELGTIQAGLLLDLHPTTEDAAIRGLISHPKEP